MRPQESEQGQLRKLTMQLQMRSWLGSSAGDKEGSEGLRRCMGAISLRAFQSSLPAPDRVNEMLRTRRNGEEERAVECVSLRESSHWNSFLTHRGGMHWGCAWTGQCQISVLDP